MVRMSVTDSRMFQETHIVRKNINLSHRYPRKPSARICPSQDRNQEGFLKEMTFQVKHADRDKPSHLPTLPRAGLRGLITVPTLPPVPKAPGPPDSHGEEGTHPQPVASLFQLAQCGLSPPGGHC